MNLIEKKEENSNNIVVMTYLKPAQLTYYVDKKGNVISIDPIVDQNNISNRPTQSMYDPASLVTTNAYNNIIIKHDDSIVFYKEDNGDQILIKNNIEFLYELNINGITYVFEQYNYAFNYLKEYITANARRI